MARFKLLDDDATVMFLEGLPPVARAKIENIIRFNLHRMGKHLERQNRGLSNTYWGRLWAAFRRRVVTDVKTERVNLDEIILDGEEELGTECDYDE